MIGCFVMSKVFDISARVKDTIVCLASAGFAYLFITVGELELAGVCIGVFSAYALKNGYKKVNGSGN